MHTFKKDINNIVANSLFIKIKNYKQPIGPLIEEGDYINYHVSHNRML